MPLLTIAEIQETLNNPQNSQQITTAAAHERRLRLHSETTINYGANQAVTEFFTWIESLIPQDKADVFKALFRYPVKSVSLTKQVFQALEKVFDGRNPVKELDFISQEAEEDHKEFFSRFNFVDKWRFDSFSRMMSAPNSFMIVDLPAEQEGNRPEPYYYFLDIENVVDFGYGDNEVTYIIFHPEPGFLAYFDVDTYQLFKLKDKTSKEVVSIEAQVPHEIGYCPAKFIATTPLNYRNKVQKASVLSQELSNFDWWLFHAISKQHLDLYASYPIYWGYEQDCDYEDTIRGLHCERGFLKSDDNIYVIDRQSGSTTLCPVCAKSRLNGAGSYAEVVAPVDREMPDLREPVGVIGIDSDSLTYNVEEQKRLALSIYTNITGYGGEPVNNQAVNEKQVLASFDSRTTVLKNLKKEFEAAEKWLIETICKLRYQSGFVSASINYGTEFYLYQPNELLEMYGVAKKEGYSDQILDILQNQYYETKYRNNPEQLQRVKLLNSLEPFRHMTKSEVKGLYDSQLINFEDFYTKLNFSGLIDRFERENGSIVEFGSEIEFEQKVKTIKEVLNGYARENQPAQTATQIEGSTATV